MSNAPASGSTAAPTVSRSLIDWRLAFILCLGLCVLMAGIIQSPLGYNESRSIGQWFSKPFSLNRAANLPRLPEADLHALWFFSETDGLIAGQSGTLLATIDGGNIWYAPQAAVAADLHTIAFSDAMTGYLGGDGNTLLKTADGGKTWTSDAAPQQQPQQQQQQQAPRAARDYYSLSASNGFFAATSEGMRSFPGNDYAVTSVRAQQVVQLHSGLFWAGLDGLWKEDLANAETKGEQLRAERITALTGKGDYAVAVGEGALWWYRVTPTAASAGAKGAAATKTPPDNSKGVYPPSSSVATVLMRETSHTLPRVTAAAMVGDFSAWLVDKNGGVHLARLERNAISITDRPIPYFTRPLYAVWAFSEQSAIVAGDAGVIFRTQDGGATWRPISLNSLPDWQNVNRFGMRVPALWCWGVLGLLAAVESRRRSRRPKIVETNEGVAPRIATDRPLEPGEADALDFTPSVQGLSKYLRNHATRPPLALAITGAWGSGKSSFMNLLRGELEREGLCTVWFNAWHHQQEPQILAPLLSTIQAEAAPSVFSERSELGARFRWKLFQRRIGSQRTLLLGLLVLFCVVIGAGFGLDWQKPAEGTLNKVWSLLKQPSEEGLIVLLGGGSFVGFLAGAAMFVWRTLSAFGVEPASLLATETGETNRRALAAQASFRRDFADEFKQVTEALAPFPLVIFIDDLDRCEVAKVFQILEAINYLVSSGECVVVLGMNEERVRDSVAAGFKDIPLEFADGDNLPDIPLDASPGATQAATWARQRRLAENYLEKLIQLRIEVPRPHPTRLGRLVSAPAEAENVAAARPASPLQRLFAQIKALRNYSIPAFIVVCLGLAVFGVSWSLTIGMRAPPPVVAPTAPTPTAVGDNSTAGTADPLTANALLLNNAPADNQAVAPPEDPYPFPRRTEPGLGFESSLVGAVNLGLFMPLALGLAVLLLLSDQAHRRTRSVVVHDTAAFTAAADRWAVELSTLLSGTLTPRALKRFQNRVRYYAMVRRSSDNTSLLALSDADLVVLGAAEQYSYFLNGNSRNVHPVTALQRLRKAGLRPGLLSDVERVATLLSQDENVQKEYQDLAKTYVESPA